MRLLTVVMLLAAGILAGTQLGKIAPLVGWYQKDIGFSLVLVGWFTAMIGMFVALAALPAGWVIERVGTRRSFLMSSLVLATGGIALAWLESPAAILTARLVEGLGYLVLVIAIPALLNSLPALRWRATALAIWGGFVPLGFAIGDFLATGMDAAANPRPFLLTVALLFAAFAAPAALLLFRIGDMDHGPAPAAAQAGRFVATFSHPVLLVSLAFGLYVVLSVGFFAFLPTFVAQAGTRIAVAAGVISLTVPIGNVIAGILVRGGSARPALWLSAAGFAITALAAVPAYSAGTAPVATGAIVVLAVAGGLTASALFAGLPFVVPAKGSTAVAIGLVCQAGGIGTLVGPPLAAWLIDIAGWSGFGWFLAATAVAGIASVAPLLLAHPIAADASSA